MGPSPRTRRMYMPKDAHLKAAEHHDNAAKAHRTAAEHHGKGDHAKGMEHSKIAFDHSVKAHEASTHAHKKSSEHKKQFCSGVQKWPVEETGHLFFWDQLSGSPFTSVRTGSIPTAALS